MKALALLCIRLYQRYVSPYKGYTCAYRRHTGHASCSALGYRAIRRHGLWRGLPVLRERMFRCGVAHRRYCTPTPRPHAQAGFCDAPCDLPCEAPSCDLPHCDSPCDGSRHPNIARAMDCMNDCNCDGCGSEKEKRRERRWWQRKKKRNEDEVHLPPGK